MYFLIQVFYIALNVNSMHFNLNRDSLWITSPIKSSHFGDITRLIPNNVRLTKCKVFNEDKMDYRLFFNFFTVKTPFFTGDRLEIVTITKNIETKNISFVVLDCYTNAITWNPQSGIQKPNSIVISDITNSKYNLDVTQTKDKNNILSLRSHKSKIYKSVSTQFSIDPNYICYFKTYNKGFRLSFNEKEIDKKVLLLKDIEIKNSIYHSFVKEYEHFFIYPNSMNFRVYIKE